MKTVKKGTSTERSAKLRALNQKKQLQQQTWNTRFRARKAAHNVKKKFKPRVQKKLAASAYKVAKEALTGAKEAKKEAKEAGAKAEAADRKASQSLDVAKEALNNATEATRFAIVLDARVQGLEKKMKSSEEDEEQPVQPEQPVRKKDDFISAR
jgi:hypothetical protein